MPMKECFVHAQSNSLQHHGTMWNYQVKETKSGAITSPQGKRSKVSTESRRSGKGAAPIRKNWYDLPLRLQRLFHRTSVRCTLRTSWSQFSSLRYAQASGFSFLNSANFASYSSLLRPCHPWHIPVGDRPHPHLLMISFLLAPSNRPPY